MNLIYVHIRYGLSGCISYFKFWLKDRHPSGGTVQLENMEDIKCNALGTSGNMLLLRACKLEKRTLKS